MASADAIAALRLLIAQTENVAPYDDGTLSDRLDAATSPEALASAIWREKAASYAGLVDVTESGSSRRMSQLYDQALKLAAALESTIPGDSVSQVGTRISKLSRS